MADPLDMLSPKDIISGAGIPREALMANMHYLHDRGLVELMMAYNPPFFTSARITADGIDLVENRFEFDAQFPPGLEELEHSLSGAPVLIERLVCEADLSPLDGETRRTLSRDIQFLREELARPADRWRRSVILAVIGWIENHTDGIDQSVETILPSLRPLREIVEAVPPPPEA